MAFACNNAYDTEKCSRVKVTGKYCDLRVESDVDRSGMVEMGQNYPKLGNCISKNLDSKNLDFQKLEFSKNLDASRKELRELKKSQLFLTKNKCPEGSSNVTAVSRGSTLTQNDPNSTHKESWSTHIEHKELSDPEKSKSILTKNKWRSKNSDNADQPGGSEIGKKESKLKNGRPNLSDVHHKELSGPERSKSSLTKNKLTCDNCVMTNRPRGPKATFLDPDPTLKEI